MIPVAMGRNAPLRHRHPRRPKPDYRLAGKVRQGRARISPPWASTSSTGSTSSGPFGETKEEDFGKQIIPRALKEGRVYGYPFESYWRDVGTIQAYWDANMDLLKPESGLNPEGCGIRTNQAAEALPYDRPPAKVKTVRRARSIPPFPRAASSRAASKIRSSPPAS